MKFQCGSLLLLWQNRMEENEKDRKKKLTSRRRCDIINKLSRLKTRTGIH